MWGLFDLNFQDLRPHIDVFEVFAAAESYYVMLDWNFNRRIHAQHDKKSRSNFSFQGRETLCTAIHSQK